MNEEELYLSILYKMINKLKDKVKFKANQIDYDNLELLVEQIDFADMKKDDFSISFQKQNSSFTLVTNHLLEEKKRQKVIHLLEDVTNLDLFASYHFTDMKNINIDHFVYDDEKKDFNTAILRDLESKKQVIELSMNGKIHSAKNSFSKK